MRKEGCPVLKHWVLAAAIVAGGTLLAQNHIHRQVSQSLKQPPSPARVMMRAETRLPQGDSLRLSAVDFISPRDGWVVGATLNKSGQWVAETIYRTVDGGKRWSSLAVWDTSHPMPAPAQSSVGLPAITRLSFQNGHSGHAVEFLGVGAGQATYGILSTRDGGRQWTLKTPHILIGSDGPVSLSFPGGGSTGWFGNGSFAGAYTLLAKTTDNGRSWTTWAQVPSPQPSPSALDMHFTSLTSAYMVVSGNGYQKTRPSLELLTTQDGGLRWQNRMLPVTGLPDLINGLSYVNPSIGWIVAAAPNHPYRLYHWSHGSWAPLATPGKGSFNPPLLDLVTAKVGYAAQSEGSLSTLWKTADGGSHWTPVKLP